MEERLEQAIILLNIIFQRKKEQLLAGAEARSENNASFIEANY